MVRGRVLDTAEAMGKRGKGSIWGKKAWEGFITKKIGKGLLEGSRGRGYWGKVRGIKWADGQSKEK